MEVFLKDRLCGEQHAVHIGEGDTPVHLKANALDVVLGSPADALPEDVGLSVDGEVLDDSTPLCGAAGVSQGCCIDVALSGARFVQMLANSQLRVKPSVSCIDMTTIPAWARRLRDVALAMVQYDGNALVLLDGSFRSDKHVVAMAVRSSRGSALQHASEDLLGDEDLLLMCFQASHGRDPSFLAQLRHKNKPFVLTVLQRHAIGRIDTMLEHVDAALQADREVVMTAVQRNGNELEYACESLRNDRQVVMAAYGGIKHTGAALRNDKELVLHSARDGCFVLAMMYGAPTDVAFASDSLRDDREVILAAVRLWGTNIKDASAALRQDTEFLREAVLWHGKVLDVPELVQPCSGSLHQSRDLVLAAVETYPAALGHAHPTLQGDREVVLAAMHSRAPWGRSLSCVPPHLKKDEEVVLAGVRHSPRVLSEADNSLRTNRNFVMQCVKLQGCSLEYADPVVSSDREVQLAAVAQDPMALEWCGESIRSNRDVVLTAVRKNGVALRHASYNLRTDREVVLASVKSYGLALQYADVVFRKDEEVVLAATHTDGIALQHADPSFLFNRDFMIAAVRKCGCAFRYASASLCRDKELQRAAILHDGRALRYADPSLRSDRSVVLQAARAHGDALQFADPVFCGDEEVVLAAVTSCGSALRFAHHTLWNKREVVLAAVRKEGPALKFARTALCCDKEVVLAAVRADPAAFIHASAPLRRDSDIVAAAFP